MEPQAVSLPLNLVVINLHKLSENKKKLISGEVKKVKYFRICKWIHK